MRKWSFSTFLAVGLLGSLPVSAVASLEVEFEFANLNQQEVYAEETSSVNEYGLFTFTNSTGVAWDSFQMILVGIGFGDSSYDFMRFVVTETFPYIGPGTATLFDDNGSGQNDGLDLSGLSVASGSSLNFSIFVQGGFFPEGMYGFRILAQPFGDTSPPPVGVPEPTAGLLLGAGLLGFAGIRRRWNKR